MTRSNQRMLLLLADGRSGLLRIADAERLQACLTTSHASAYADNRCCDAHAQCVK